MNVCVCHSQVNNIMFDHIISLFWVKVKITVLQCTEMIVMGRICFMLFMAIVTIKI